MFLWIHLLIAILFIFTFIMGLTRRKNAFIYQMISRTFYLIFLITGGFLFFKAFHRAPMLLSFKAIFAFIFIVAAEYGFAKNNSNKMNKHILWILMLMLILLIIVGFLAAGGRPFI
ncbi:DUF1516 family protein [Apilactobacillus xinyiensis]|uniref:DUF1516 family protein n=1 Tax=Apilactobacillus xinyiensis TaxID=2841032 RepID=UPI001C7CD2C5|nr:DUF1516 family protein [Apilactobacillus xinyiensis]